ncbi:MAG TPA: transglycosylase SLT domain-containing protein, partial [Kofleriaceae bacterium]|nr:transglycosylase SLT domain-containing protein [Kofleriaceae bacterium]
SVAAAVAVAVGAVAAGEGTAWADIYSYTDREGVVHFTNIKPRGRAGARWKRLSNEASVGKAAARRGSCDRCDVVPARDRSAQRFARFDEFIAEASLLYAIPVPLIRAVIRVESDYDPAVVSSVGARGLMQLMPSVVHDMGVRNVHDPRENILGGTRLLRILANRYDGDLVRTIAAYHAGSASLARYGDNVPPYENTRKYLRMVVDRYYQYVAAERRLRAAN